MSTDVVIYELSVIKQAYLHLTPEQRALDNSVMRLIQKYDEAVSVLGDPELRRVYELLYVKGLSFSKVAFDLHYDKRTIFRKNLKLVSYLASVG